MKTPLHLSCLLLLVCGLAACASTQTLQRQFEEAIDQHQLAIAEKKLLRLEPKIDADQYQSYQTQWQKHFRQEVAGIAKDTEKLLAQQKWTQALEHVRQQKQRLGDQDSLLALEERIRQHEQETLAKVHQDWMLSRAATLAQQRARLMLAEQGNSEQAHDMRQWLAQETPLVSRYLSARSASAAGQKDWRLVMETQQLLERISPEEMDASLRRQAQSQLDNARTRAQHQRTQQQRQQFEQLFAAFRKQRDAKHLAALKHFAETHRSSLEDESLLRVQQEVDAFIAEKTLLGDRAYAESRFREARNHWREAHQLAPTSEALRQKLARVERVLSSLKALEN